MNIIFLGDVFGKSGRKLVLDQIKRLKEVYACDCFIINGENLADGKGLTEKTTKPLFEAGVDIITGGNHLWDRAESLDYIQKEPRIIKPMNYPATAFGNPYVTFETEQARLLVLNLVGQVFMPPCDSPLAAMETFINQHPELDYPILVDFHAESTAEKRAFAQMFDGQISAVLGTHTHVQTADEEILPDGTGYLTDAGMTGPHDSVIGIKKHLILQKMTTGMPVRFEVSELGLQINGVFLQIDPSSHKTTQIQRIRELY